VDAWTRIRFLHIVALAFFVGGQLDALGRRRPGGAAPRR